MQRNLPLFLLLCLLAGTSSLLNAQDTRWYFGSTPAWLHWDSNLNVQQENTQKTPFGAAGAAVATDPESGELFFYTDGLRLYDSGNNLVSSSLGGDVTKTNPVMLVPKAGNSEVYFIFVNTPTHTLQYYEYNYVTKSLGGVQAVGGLSNVADALEIIRQTDQFGYWLVVPIRESAQIRIVSVGSGVSVTPAIDLSANMPSITAHSLSYSPEKATLALGGSEGDSAGVYLLSFNTQVEETLETRLTFHDTLKFANSATGNISGLVWKGNYLYVAKEKNAVGANGAVWRANVNNALKTPDDQPYLPMELAQFATSYGLKEGPDGVIYHLYQNGSGQQIGGIFNSIQLLPQFREGLFGGISFGGSQFPQLAPPPYEDEPDIPVDIVGICKDNPTYFYPDFNDKAPDSITWKFDDGVYKKGLQPNYTYDGSQTYTVKFWAYFTGSTKENSFNVTIKEAPQLIAPNDTTVCPGDVLELEVQLQTADGTDITADGSYEVTWYRPISSDKTLDAGELKTEVGLTNISMQAIEFTEDGKTTFPEAGTYYVIARPTTDPTACVLTASFLINIYERESSNGTVWYFGNGAGIDFNYDEARAVGPTAMQTPDEAMEGVAIEADINGDVIIYTNGEKIWFGRNPAGDKDDVLATNGEDIGGSVLATQAALIVPFPSEPALYYVFTLDEAGNFRYTVADYTTLSVEDTDQGPNPFIKGKLLHSNASEKLTGSISADSNILVVTHLVNSNTFVTIPISEEGIGNPRFDRAGSVLEPGQKAGAMRFSSTGGYVAVTFPDDVIEVYRFDSDAEKISNEFIRLQLSNATGPLYGMEFIEDKIFVTTTGSNSQLYQYTLDSAFTSAGTQETEKIIVEGGTNWGALQQGPTGLIYMAIDGGNQLATFSAGGGGFSVDTPPALLAGTNSELGLPNFISNLGDSIPPPTVEVIAGCEGEDIFVSGQRRYLNETYIYEILDENGNPFSPPIRYGNPDVLPGGEGLLEDEKDTLFTITQWPALVAGNYIMDLKLASPCELYPNEPGEDPIQMPFTIYPIPEAAVDGPTSRPLCENQSVTFEGRVLINGDTVSSNGYTFIWFDGLSGEQLSTNPQLTVTEAGAWQLIVLDSASGCESAPINVEVLEQRPEADLGEDINLCTGGALPVNELSISLANPSDFIITWKLAENSTNFQELNNSGTSQDLGAVNTEQPGIFRYLVEVRSTDPSQNCFRADTLTVAVNLPPTVTLRPTGNNCNGTTTLVAEVTGIDTDDVQYEFIGPGGSLGTTFSPSTTVTASGTYSVRILPPDGNCEAESDSITIDVNNGLADLHLEANPGCAPEGVLVQNEITMYSSYSGKLHVQFINITDGFYLPDKPYEGIRTPYTFPPRADGTYLVIAQAIDNAGCTDPVEAEITVKSTIVPTGSLNDKYTICPEVPELSTVLLSLPGFTSYRWTEAGSGQVLSTADNFTVNESGQYELLLDACNIPIPFEVAYNCTPRLFLPNAIRVNGQNPIFRILNPSLTDAIENFQILIFNRWGEVIYQSTDPAFTWYGEDRSGDLVMTGTYQYLITYRNTFGENQNIQKQQGGITVLH